MGRTGKMFAIEHWGVEPDIVITAKGIASGLPLGAFMARATLMELAAGRHGNTFGGNPVPCAAGLATLEVIKSEGLLANAAEQGETLLAGLRELHATYPGLITGVRGTGLMIGVEFHTAEQAERGPAPGIRTWPAGTRMRRELNQGLAAPGHYQGAGQRRGFGC